MPAALVAKGKGTARRSTVAKNEHPSYTVRYRGGIGLAKAWSEPC